MGQPVEFLRPFRFAVRVDGREVGIAFVGEIAVERMGANLRARPVTLVAVPRAGGYGLAALVYGKRRHDVTLDEMAADGSVGRFFRLRGCRFRRYSCDPHDAMGADAVLIERVTLHPTRVEVGAPAPAERGENMAHGGEHGGAMSPPDAPGPTCPVCGKGCLRVRATGRTICLDDACPGSGEEGER